MSNEEIGVVSAKQAEDVVGVPVQPNGFYVDDDDLKWTETELRPGTFKVIQARANHRLDLENVESMRDAIRRKMIRRKIIFRRLDVYEDVDTHERFSGDGAHFSEACKEEGMLVPVRIAKVKNAFDVANRKSLSANLGKSRSPADTRHNVMRAITTFGCKTTKEIVELTQVSRPYAAKMLKLHFAGKLIETGNVVDSEMENTPPEANTSQEKSLSKILAILRAYTPNSEDGDYSIYALSKIKDEIKRIEKSLRKPVEFDSKMLGEFKTRHSLSLEQLGGLLDTSHSTISRWFNGKAKPSRKQMKNIEDLMALTGEQVQTLLEETTNE